MRQVGSMREGELMQADFAAEILQSGERVIVRRRLADGTNTYFPATVKSQPLTPTFVHTLNNEGRENVHENDQRDIVAVARIPLIKDLDTIQWEGYDWNVSTTSEPRQNGVTVVTHCLCVKQGAKNREF